MAVEVALVTILLAAGSLLARSWMVLHAQDTGLDADRVVAVRAAPPGSHDAARVKAFNDRLAEAIRRVPGVTSVDFVDVPLLQRAVRGSKFVPPARVRHPAGMDTDVRITPGYFATMGIRILQGRELRTDDRGRGVVVSDELARRYWRGRSPVGELVTYGDSTREIVGVVSSARDVMLDGAPMPTLYHVWDDRDAPIATVVARTIGAPQRAIPQIRRAVREVDGRAAITMLATLDELLDRSVAERHFNTLLFGVFAVAALALGLVGIYGLVAVLVSRREREMGIRLALGATGTEVLLFVMSGTLRWVAAGLLAGLVVAWRQAGYVRPFVFGITETDPLTLGLVSAGFLLVAAAATYVPARRAARVDPVVALRAE